MKRPIPQLITLVLFGLNLPLNQNAIAQVFTVNNTSVTITGHAHANDFIVPDIGGVAVFDEDSCVFAPQPLVAGF